jgi:hypothetical protein
MEPRIGFMITPPTLADSRLGARIRTGSSDYIHVDICARRYQAFVYIGCYGSAGADFYAADNGIAKPVVFRGDSRVSGSEATIGLTLAWTPVNIQPATLTLWPYSVVMNLGDPAVTVTATAYDAAGSAVPGLPVAWSTPTPSVVAVNANGDVGGVSAGSGSVTATVSGLSASVGVYIGTGITVDIGGPTRARPGNDCSFYPLVKTNGLTAPLSYAWSASNGATGFDSVFDVIATTSYTVNLTVTDAAGRRGVANGHRVTVGTTGVSCIQ